MDTQKLNIKRSLKAIAQFMNATHKEAKLFIEKIIRRIQTSAVKLPPKQEVRITQLPEFTIITEFYQNKLSKLRADFLPVLEHYLNSFEQSRQALFYGEIPYEEYKEQVTIINEEASEQKEKAKQKFSKLHIEKQKQREQLIKLHKASEIKLSHQKKHNLKIKYTIGGILYSIITIGEVLLNASSFQLVQSLLFSIIISLAFSMALILIGIGLAKLLTNTHMEHQKRIASIVGLLILVASFFYTLSILKSQYVAVRPHQLAVQVSPLLFWFLNVILFIACICVKLFVLPSKKQRVDNQNYEVIKTEAKEHKKNIKKKEYETLKLTQQSTSAIKKIEQQTSQKTAQLTKKFQTLVDNYNNSGSAYNQILSNLLHCEDQINSLYKSTLSEFIQAMNESRIDGKVMLFDSTIPHLKALFSEYNIKTEFRFTMDKDHSHSQRKKQQSKHKNN